MESSSGLSKFVCLTLAFFSPLVFVLLHHCPLVLSGEAAIAHINHRGNNKPRKKDVGAGSCDPKPSSDVQNKHTFAHFDSFVHFSRQSLGISAYNLFHLTLFSIIYQIMFFFCCYFLDFFLFSIDF